MNLDIRMPMGIMFSVFGLILAAWGLVTVNDPMYQRSLGWNINLLWGVVMLAFGSVMIYFARKGMRK